MKAISFYQIALFAVAILILPVLAVAGDSLSITDVEGKTIEVSPVSSDGMNFTFVRKSDSKRFTIKLSQLDSASRGEVKNWFQEGKHMSTEYEIDVNMRDHDSSDTIIRGNFRRGFINRDVESLTFEPRVTIFNRSLTQPTKPADVCVMTIFKSPAAPKVQRVYSLQYFDLPELGSNKKHVEQLPETGGTFNEYRAPEYVGYVILILDPESREVLGAEASPPSLLGEDPSNLVDLKRGSAINKDK